MTIGVETGIKRLVVELPCDQHRVLKTEAVARGIPLKELARERLTQPCPDKPGERRA